MIEVRVPATSANLGPGYDAFGAALDLHLVARTVPATDEARVTSRGEGAGELSRGDDNLVWRSFVAGCERFEAAVPDVGIEIDNAIPLERGLGSSSAAIVAGLALARGYAPNPVGDRDLAVLADELEGHPDNVVPAILGGLTVTARRDGGGLSIRRINPHPALHPVVFVPTERQSTVGARGVVPSELPTAEVADQAARAGHVIGGLVGAWPVEPAVSGDRLHEPPRFEAMPRSGRLVGALRDGGVHAWLSGAGPSVAAAPRSSQLDLCRRIAEPFAVQLRTFRWDLAGVVTIRRDS